MTPARLAKLQRAFDVAKDKAEDALAARDRAFESLKQAKMMAQAEPRSLKIRLSKHEPAASLKTQAWRWVEGCS